MHIHMNERTATEVFSVVLIGLMVVSIFFGYWKIVVLHDFTIFTSEEDGGAYIEIQ